MPQLGVRPSFSPSNSSIASKQLKDQDDYQHRLAYHRGIARRAMPVENLLTAAQLYESTRLKWLAVGE